MLNSESMTKEIRNVNEKMPLRVLWIAQGCSLQDDKENLGLSGRMESIMTRYCGDRIRLAVAYMADGVHESKFTQNDIVYYAADSNLGVGLEDHEWERSKAELLRIIDDFHPDIIQCFGSEWPYGLIAENVAIPVVIHMMGFLNIYFLSVNMANGTPDLIPVKRNKLLEKYQRNKIPESKVDRCKRYERRVMSSNRYFFGRTNWDKNIVRYYSPNSRYFHVPEMIKPYIYDAAGQWKYHYKRRIKLFSLSSADDRKGNEIILRTAEILKNILHLNVLWKVAGQKDSLIMFEQRTGIKHQDVGIKLIGMIGSKEIVEEMKSADLCIHPSIMDNSPHSVCEAQLVGCPIIASNVGGVSDLVSDGETGFLYPYNEPHTLAFMIANLYQDEDLLTRISENEVRTAKSRHDPEAIASTMLHSYETIIEDYRHG